MYILGLGKCRLIDPFLGFSATETSTDVEVLHVTITEIKFISALSLPSTLLLQDTSCYKKISSPMLDFSSYLELKMWNARYKLQG